MAAKVKSEAKFWRELALVEFPQLFWEAYAICSSQLELPVDLMKVLCYRYVGPRGVFKNMHFTVKKEHRKYVSSSDYI